MRQPAGQPDVVVYNEHVTLAGIPSRAHDYVINGKSALGWVIDRYQVRTDSDSGIVNDPNAWSAEVGDPRYIVDLVKRVVAVSMQTLELVDGLPEFAPVQTAAMMTTSSLG
jgi:predicted helicase